MKIRCVIVDDEPLALDVLEELRAPLADRIALSLINRRQLTARDFENQETGAVLLTDSPTFSLTETVVDLGITWLLLGITRSVDW